MIYKLSTKHQTLQFPPWWKKEGFSLSLLQRLQAKLNRVMAVTDHRKQTGNRLIRVRDHRARPVAQ